MSLHHHSDGTIDVDFYCRRAMRQRRLLRRLVFRRLLAAMVSPFRSSGRAGTKSTEDRGLAGTSIASATLAS